MTQSIPDSLDCGTLGVEEEEREVEDVRAWGRLVSLSSQLASVELVEERVYTLGRLESNDVQVSCPIVSGSHVRVWRDEKMSSTVLRDTSTNGTYVNDVKLGKGKQTLLTNGAKITLAKANLALKPQPIVEELAYVFVDCREEAKEQHAGGPQAKYDLKETLGTGAFATVRKAVDKVTFETFAIKIISKKKFCQSPEGRKHSLMDEVEILRRLDHANIIGIKEVFDTDVNLYLVLELVTGGELFDYIVEKELFGEEETRRLFVQMLHTMVYLHSQGVAHRDLKLENILLKDSARDVIKISDFGLSRIIGEGSFMKTICGTPEYLAPEVLTNAKAEGYGIAVDMWSLGVVLYTMVCGYRPFEASGGSNVLERVLKGVFDFPPSSEVALSDSLKDLISQLLTVNPKERMTAVEALQHPWITQETGGDVDGEEGNEAGDKEEKEEKVEEEVEEEEEKVEEEVEERADSSSRKRGRDSSEEEPTAKRQKTT